MLKFHMVKKRKPTNGTNETRERRREGNEKTSRNGKMRKRGIRKIVILTGDVPSCLLAWLDGWLLAREGEEGSEDTRRVRRCMQTAVRGGYPIPGLHPFPVKSGAEVVEGFEEGVRGRGCTYISRKPIQTRCPYSASGVVMAPTSMCSHISQAHSSYLVALLRGFEAVLVSGRF
ncbi:hypothetical protein M0804_007735 [Polistes exclamans]|nr:hypothetical protein M0804_007735 [Polistes exclamans]